MVSGGVSLPILTDDGEKDVLIFVLFLGMDG